MVDAGLGAGHDPALGTGSSVDQRPMAMEREVRKAGETVDGSRVDQCSPRHSGSAGDIDDLRVVGVEDRDGGGIVRVPRGVQQVTGVANLITGVHR